MYDLNGDHDEPPKERQPIASEESSDHDPAEQRPEFLRQRDAAARKRVKIVRGFAHGRAGSRKVLA